jgi:hypothetical protein
MELPEALKHLLKLKGRLEWDFKIANKEETKVYIEAIDCIVEELKDFCKGAKEEAEFNLKVSRYLEDSQYVTREDVKEIIQETIHSHFQF